MAERIRESNSPRTFVEAIMAGAGCHAAPFYIPPSSVDDCWTSEELGQVRLFPLSSMLYSTLLRTDDDQPIALSLWPIVDI